MVILFIAAIVILANIGVTLGDLVRGLGWLGGELGKFVRN